VVSRRRCNCSGLKSASIRRGRFPPWSQSIGPYKGSCALRPSFRSPCRWLNK
ncbi:hypothetical protein NDU88_001226, partial [Pleurodeles waltl]